MKTASSLPSGKKRRIEKEAPFPEDKDELTTPELGLKRMTNQEGSKVVNMETNL